MVSLTSALRRLVDDSDAAYLIDRIERVEPIPKGRILGCVRALRRSKPTGVPGMDRLVDLVRRGTERDGFVVEFRSYEPYVETFGEIDRTVVSVEGEGYVAAWSRNGRVSMEDEHDVNGSTFCVFDGHFGDVAAKHCKKRFVSVLDSLAGSFEDRAREACLVMDRELRGLTESGTTLTCLRIEGSKAYVAHVGDSECALVRKRGTFSLTERHLPSNEIERITKAGGYVERDRVDGQLAMSRSIGDFEFKRDPALDETTQKVVAVPDVSVFDIDSTQDEFIVLATDGLWDGLLSIHTLRDTLVKGTRSEAECLVEHAQKYGEGDNVLVVVVNLCKLIR